MFEQPDGPNSADQDNHQSVLPLPAAQDGLRPKDARWYLADVVVEHTVEGDPRNVVHVNVHLIEADSPGGAGPAGERRQSGQENGV